MGNREWAEDIPGLIAATFPGDKALTKKAQKAFKKLSQEEKDALQSILIIIGFGTQAQFDDRRWAATRINDEESYHGYKFGAGEAIKAAKAFHAEKSSHDDS